MNERNKLKNIISHEGMLSGSNMYIPLKLQHYIESNILLVYGSRQ
jgi:hypothetical protein